MIRGDDRNVCIFFFWCTRVNVEQLTNGRFATTVRRGSDELSRGEQGVSRIVKLAWGCYDERMMRVCFTVLPPELGNNYFVYVS